ncbi:MAG: hypothetical protein JXA89_00895 [Anaerolineae bacterium]|nr:hypothetical protein [Anaerolineae bacterium]
MKRVWLIVVGLVLAGCTFTDTYSLAPGYQTLDLYGSQTIGQTVVCHHAGLASIDVLLQAQPESDDLVLHLLETENSPADIATVTLSPQPGELSFHRFEFPIQDDVNGTSLFIRLESPETSPEHAIRIPYNPVAPSDQVLVVNQAQTPGKLSLQLNYSSFYIAKDLVRQAGTYGIKTLWLLFLSALLYLLPGGAAVAWLLPEGDGVERAVVAIGLSITFYTLVIYATLTGLRLGSAFAWSILAGSGLLLALRPILNQRRSRMEPGVKPLDLKKRLAVQLQDPAGIVLGIVIFLVFAIRIWTIRDMIAPRWGDSYQHAVITRLLLDHGGIFESWEPYAPYTGLTVHFGFHANAAFLAWTSGLDATQSVLWAGQILNALAAIALYPLGKQVAGRWGGVLAVLIAGIVTTTPLAYMNWGRYPQLTGQVLLPIAAWLLWRTLDHPTFDWKRVALTGLAVAAQVLAYYRMPYYFAAWAGAWAICMDLPRYKAQWSEWAKWGLRIIAIVAIAALILIPWGLRVMHGRLGDAVVQGLSGDGALQAVVADYEQWKTLPTYVAAPLLIAAGMAFIWALIRRSGPAIAAGIWAWAMFSLVATRLIQFPGASHLNAFATMIVIYAPVSLLVGWLGAQLAQIAGQRWGKKGVLAGASILVVLTLPAAYRTLTVPDTGYDLVEPGDIKAMAWIRDNTSPAARFLVNGFLVYDGQSAVGSDAGWWIPLLAGRENTMPPQYALMTEKEAEPGYGQGIVDLVTRLQETPVTTPQSLELLCERAITHVYIGQGEGRVGSPPPTPLFTAEQMLSSPAFTVLYHQDNVWIFVLQDNVCAS